METILVTGADGQLGMELRQIATQNKQFKFLFTTKNELDISNPELVEQYFNKLTKENSLYAIINGAAYTAVDKAESELNLAMQTNGIAPSHLALIAKKSSIKFIHISTDFVFDGTKSKPYLESDVKNPISVYGKSKSVGEDSVIEVNPDSFIIRTSWVYSQFGKNFMKTILKLASEKNELNVIYDQIGTPTWASDLAYVCIQFLSNANLKSGIYHYSNEGIASWYDFAHAIIEMSGLSCKVKPIPTEKYPTPAKRPSYSVLSKEKIKETLNLEIPHWRDSLQKCLRIINNDLLAKTRF